MTGKNGRRGRKGRKGGGMRFERALAQFDVDKLA